jgi:hypothetical protein
MSCLKYTTAERKGTTAQVCASASLRMFDRFHDTKWNWHPERKLWKSRRKLKPMSYRQLVEFMMREHL